MEENRMIHKILMKTIKLDSKATMKSLLIKDGNDSDQQHIKHPHEYFFTYFYHTKCS